MGREIRRVPPNWNHPRRACPHSPLPGGCEDAKKHNGECYQPMFDSDYETEVAEWIKNHQLWLCGEHPDQMNEEYDTSGCKYFAEWDGNAPDVEYYRPKWEDGAATWFQLYETVSEGTPVSPPFATEGELIDYLATHGDFWSYGPYSRAAAEQVVRGGWAPSGIAVGGRYYSGAEGLVAIAEAEASAK